MLILYQVIEIVKHFQFEVLLSVNIKEEYNFIMSKYLCILYSRIHQILQNKAFDYIRFQLLTFGLITLN